MTGIGLYVFKGSKEIFRHGRAAQAMKVQNYFQILFCREAPRLKTKQITSLKKFEMGKTNIEKNTFYFVSLVFMFVVIF